MFLHLSFFPHLSLIFLVFSPHHSFLCPFNSLPHCPYLLPFYSLSLLFLHVFSILPILLLPCESFLYSCFLFFLSLRPVALSLIPPIDHSLSLISSLLLLSPLPNPSSHQLCPSCPPSRHQPSLHHFLPPFFCYFLHHSPLSFPPAIRRGAEQLIEKPH